ncbi:unnamed protein product [Protopolystoma xenopodis]|uniref:Kazal-like domain-containing protein n=1 Tax=Protopolystoma xenopodis TaxID=117903 RepID=A0A448XR86_9PLAT|nr:unnamed protein product [Protopolystoma xenopodis]
MPIASTSPNLPILLWLAVLLVSRADAGWLSNDQSFRSQDSAADLPHRGRLGSQSLGPADELEPCPDRCNTTLCPPITKCNMGLVRDRCGCCSICGLEQDQLCNLEADLVRLMRGGPGVSANAWHGRCGVNLECRERSDVDANIVGQQSICYCLKDGLVCGSNGVTYSSCQMTAVQEAANGTVFMVSQGPCKSGESCQILRLSPLPLCCTNNTIASYSGIFIQLNLI